MDGNKMIALFVDNLKGISRREKLKLFKYITGCGCFDTLDGRNLTDAVNGYISISREKIQETAQKAEKIAEKCRADGIIFVSYNDYHYPSLLKEIYDPPVILYIKGVPAEPDWVSAAVVGTRKATGKALKAAFDTGYVLGSGRVTVVSGLAIGIDAEAHKGCLAASGRTAAVLGSGLDMVYPWCNRKIAEKILAQGGMLISEYPPGTEPLKYHFPERNRIISGLSSAVIVVQAPARSGALITADYAAESGRDVYVHEDGLSPVYGAGGIELADNGAEVINTESEYKYRIFSSEIFNNLQLLEDEITGKVINYKGVLYRRKYA